MLQKIYREFIKNQPPNLMTIPSYPLLIVCEWILGIASVSLPNISPSSSILTLVMVLLATVLVSILSFSSLIVLGVSCETVKLECNDFTSDVVSREKFTYLIGRFRKLQELCKSYLFITYSSYVLLLVAYMYQISIFLQGCQTNILVSTFVEKNSLLLNIII